MSQSTRNRRGLRHVLALAAFALLLTAGSPQAATQRFDLDGNQSTESRCDLNVLSTFPVVIENVVTNAAVGEGFEFSWPSAGPGGFHRERARRNRRGRWRGVDLVDERIGLRLRRQRLRVGHLLHR